MHLLVPALFEGIASLERVSRWDKQAACMRPLVPHADGHPHAHTGQEPAAPWASEVTRSSASM